jgi:hypothetical protein
MTKDNVLRGEIVYHQGRHWAKSKPQYTGAWFGGTEHLLEEAYEKFAEQLQKDLMERWNLRMGREGR